MSSGPAVASAKPAGLVPFFPLPEISQVVLSALALADLDRFYEKNRDAFHKLVAVVYAGFFLEHTDELRARKASPQKLLELFCSHIEMIFTAASPQWESLRLEKPDKPELTRANGIAREFLWNHLKRQGVATWQDHYSEGKGKRKASKVEKLIKDFVRYVVARAFEGQAAVPYVTDPQKLKEARRLVYEINVGDKSLKPV